MGSSFVASGEDAPDCLIASACCWENCWNIFVELLLLAGQIFGFFPGQRGIVLVV